MVEMALLTVIRRRDFLEGSRSRRSSSGYDFRATPSGSTCDRCRKAKVQSSDRPSNLHPFAWKLSAWLRIEATESRNQRRTAWQTHTVLASLGYRGSYFLVATFVRGLESGTLAGTGPEPAA